MARRLLARALSSRAAWTSLPVVDVSALRGLGGGAAGAPPSAAAREAGAALHAACAGVGFFYVTNHGVGRGVAERAREEARRWFETAPDEAKRAVSIANCPSRCRGYQALGANVTRFDGGFARDYHEALDLYKEVPPDASLPLHSPNQWPEGEPQLREALEDWVREATSLGADLLYGIGLGLELRDPEFFLRPDTAADPFWVLRVIHYPTLEAAPDAATGLGDVSRSENLSCGEHTDYGLLTIVNQDEHASSLQVRNTAGEWVAADPIPGAFVCNVGDMFQTWTNGQYEPTLHRVVHTDRSASRISLPFFYEPCFDAVVSPIPELVGAEGPRYEPVTYGDHLRSKVEANFEL